MTGLAIAEDDAKPDRDYRPDIDGLRAVAVVSVVLFHAGYRRFTGGFVGVDIFFVISGFLITRIVRDQVAQGTFSFGKFYLRRVRRLFPALAATVVLTAVAAALFYAPDLFKSVGLSATTAVLSVANIYFWLNSGYFDPASGLNPLLHTWSLSVEEQFYLVWPLILLVAARWRAAFPVLVGLAIASILGGIALRNDPSAVFYLMPFRVFELAIGGMMVWVVERVAVPRWGREVALLIAFALIGFAVLTFTEATPFPINGLIPCVGAAIVILCGNAKYLGLVLRNRVSVAIGLISYSVYLVHWPVVVFYQYVVNNELGALERVAMVGAALAGGLAMHRLVENRFRYAGPTSWRPSRFAMASGAMAGIVALAGLHAGATGWSWRLGDREVAFLDMRDVYGGAGCRPPRCETGSGAPLILVGDSHARSYYTGLRDHFPDRRLIVYESSGCPFFSPGVTRDYGAAIDRDLSCREVRAQAFEEIRRERSDVVLAQNWYLLDMVDEATGEPVTFATADAWAEFAAMELARLRRALGIEHLLVIGNVPTSAGLVSPLDCVARPVRLDTVSCGATPRDHPTIVERAHVNGVLRDRLDKVIGFVDPFEYLCDQRTCANFDGGWPLYFDETHLTTWGSRRVVSGMMSGPARSALGE